MTSRLRAGVAAVPTPLAGLLVAVALFGIAWALIVPAFQSPDEDVHFAYVQTLAQRHALPGSGPHAVSTAENDAVHDTNGDAQELGSGQPPWGGQTYRAWLALTAHDSESDGGGPNTASTYPPAYYAAETIGYGLAGPHANVLDHLYAARLFSVLWLLLTTVGVWMLAGELTGRRRVLQLAAAGAVGLWPMLDFMSASVNPDSLLYATWTWTLWAGVVILRHGLTPRRGAILGGVTALALLTKATSLALLPAVGFVLAVGLWRLGRGLPRAAVIAGAVALAVFLVPVGAWEVGTRLAHRSAYAQATSVTGGGAFNVREFLSYVWEYYLPRLPGQQLHHLDLPVISSYPAYNVWVATGWAAFGWVTVYFGHGVYPWFLAITVAVGVLAAVRLASLWRRHRGQRVVRSEAVPIAIFLALALVALVGGLHLTEYRLDSPTNQGRYLFPLAGLAGCAVALALTVLPRRARPIGLAALLAALVVFQFACLALVGGHYYA